MSRTSRILIAALLCGCGSPSAPARHAPATVPQGDEGASVPSTGDGQEHEPPVHVITGANPLPAPGPPCKGAVDPLPDGSLPVVESEEQLEDLLGCETQLEVDWDKEHVVPITLEGINKGWSLEGQSTQAGITTITILTDTMMRGAALQAKEFWLVRVPASTQSVVIEWTYTPTPADAPAYP